MAKKMERDMRVADKRIREAVDMGVPTDGPLIKNGLEPKVVEKISQKRSELLGKKRPTRAQEELLEKYRVKNKLNVVENGIDEVITSDIVQIRETVDNMLRYGDSRVFKVLPEEVANMVETYGVAVQEYFSEKSAKMRDLPVYIIPVTHNQCNCCGDFKDEEDFYISTSDASRGRVPVCKVCCSELFRKYMKMYKNDVKESLIILSQKLDLYVYEPVLRKYVDMYMTSEGKSAYTTNRFVGMYVGDLNVQKLHNQDINKDNFEHSRLNGIPFKLVTQNESVPIIYTDRFLTPGESDSESDDWITNDEELTSYRRKKLEDKFGKYPHQELKWLERRYIEWEDEFDISALNERKLVAQMCCDELMMRKDREEGRDTNQKWNSYMATMKNLGLTPKQQKKSSTQTGFSSFGELLKAAEKRGPIISKDPEFEDVDRVNRFIVGISGAIARTLGRNNDNSEAFEQIFSDYQSNLLGEDMVGDDDG